MAKGKKASAAAKAQATKAEAKPKADAKNDVFEDDGETITELKVNQKFAKEYMDRKRKEELTKLEKQRAFLEESDEDESESETEDEDAEELTEELDNDIKKTLRLIRNKDPIIYDSSVAFFKPKENGEDEESDSDAEDKKKTKKSEKKSAPLYYKDLVRQQVIAGDVGSDEEDEDSKPPVMTYGEEQAKIKQDFLKSLKQAEESDDDDNDAEDNDSDLEGGLFSVRTKSDAEKQQEDEEYEQFKSKYGTKLKKDTIDPEAFLENYLNGGWKEKKNEIPHYEDIVKEDEEDAEELEKMEDFEHAYNFRFEEEGNGLIQTYSRNIDDSMRRKDDKRKLKREERKERKALERLKKEEELRRLKNLKQAEIQSKLEKISKLVGKVSEEDRLQKVLSEDLDGDFDPDAYDKRMQQIFDDQYYNEDDDEVMEKPTWDDEEDKALFADLPVDEEEEEADESAGDEAEVAPENSDADKEPTVDEDNEDEFDDEQEEADGDDDEKYKNMTPEELERAKQKYLDELYSLDYEDLIGDLKCRFRYRQVHKNDFGLTADEIMAADDKELKALVSLKRIAPYMEEEYNVNRRKIKSFKKSLEQKQAEAAANKKTKKKKTEEIETSETAATDAAPTKKRKRTKKSKQEAVATEPEPAHKDNTDPAAGETESVDQQDDAKQEKKKRRSKKKKVKHEPNPFAATGLSSSRLESYKLIKPKN